MGFWAVVTVALGLLYSGFMTQASQSETMSILQGWVQRGRYHMYSVRHQSDNTSESPDRVRVAQHAGQNNLSQSAIGKVLVYHA